MDVVGLADQGFVARCPLEFRLANHARFEKDLERAVNGGQSDPVALFEHPFPNLLDSGMVLGLEQRLPDQLALRGLLEVLLGEKVLETILLPHRSRDYNRDIVLLSP